MKTVFKTPSARNLAGLVSGILLGFLLWQLTYVMPQKAHSILDITTTVNLVFFIFFSGINSWDRITGKHNSLFLALSIITLLIAMITKYVSPISVPVDDYNMVIQALCGLSLFIIACIDFLDYRYVILTRKT